MKLLFVVVIFVVTVWGSNFSQGIRLFKKGEYKDAKHFFELAFEEDGVKTAGYFLGLYHLRGLGGIPKDFAIAERYLSKAASIGNVRAQCALAELYLATKRVDKAKEILKTNNAQECVVLKKRIEKNKTKKD